MTQRETKIQKLLTANKAQFPKSHDRIVNARLILTADDFGLEVIADTLGVTF